MRVLGVSLPLPHGAPARHARRGRRSWRFVDVLVALLLVVLVVVAALNPNQPWMKRHLQAFVLTRTGLDVDYRWIHLHLLSGVEVDDLVVHSPPDFRPAAPDLLRVSHLDVRWSPSSLLVDGPRLEGISLADVQATVVVDEGGRTSLDAVLSPGAPASAPTPLSRWPVQQLATAPLMDRLDVTGAEVEILRTLAGRVVERDRIRGLEVAVTAEPTECGWRVAAAAGAIAEPLDVRLTQERSDGPPPHEARAGLSLRGVLTATALEASLDLDLREQSLATGLELGDWHAQAGAVFQPDAGRTTVALEGVTSPAGAATLEASIELPDAGPPVVRHAQGDIDVTRVLGWIPAGLMPLTAESGILHFEVQSAILEQLPRLSEGGLVHVDADLTRAHVRMSAGTLDVERSRGVLNLVATTGPGLALQGWQHVEAASAEAGGTRVDARDLMIAVDAERTVEGAFAGRFDLRFGRLQQRTGTVVAVVRDGRGKVRLDGLEVSGAANRSLHVREIDASGSGVVQVLDRGHGLVAAAPAHAGLDLRDVFADTRVPLVSRATIRAWADVGEDRVSVEAVKRPDAIDYTLRVVAPSLKAVRPFLLPPVAEAADWDAMGIDLRSKGHVERTAGLEPRLQQEASLDVDRPAFGGFSARSLSLILRSEGTAAHHHADANVRASSLAIDGTPASDDALSISVTWDRDPGSLQLQARTAGRADAQIEVSAAFDDGARAVVYDANGRFSGLGGLAPLARRVRGLEGFDLSRLEVAVGARGALLGVVSGIGPGVVDLQPDPWREAAIEGAVDVRVRNLRWAGDAVALSVPAVVWHGDMHAGDGGRVLAMHTDVPSARLALGRNEIDLRGIWDETTAVVQGDLLDPAVELTQRSAVRVVDQDFLAAYPAADATLALSARREPRGLVRVSALHVHDSAGTTLDLRGGIDLGARRSRKLSMAADVVQDLQPLSFLPGRFWGRGEVKVSATVESPDLAFFRTRLDVTAARVQVRVPGVGVEAQSVDADIPVRLDFDADGNGVRLRRDGHNRYAMLRFPDQHPFLIPGGFVSIARITTRQLEIAPFVGSLAVEQNVVSLRQFEMGVRGGRLAGECSLDWNGPSSSLALHLRAAGVQSTYGEPLDGNMAVVISASDRSIEGRAEILRMGKRHLLDVLDVEDPLRVDPTMNRIRSALAFGYPSRLHLAFGSGFARARVELGGLAQFMSIDEMRGIPTGPLVDWLVKAVLDGKMAP